ncbi:hypothetical protein GGTG_07853 [Gaeumannomyces tritici R3-111a-1]|uniref:Uncharacterized protein n=1 Tax=Gaeumannomyces tritici (strain R3-111a-1) TaxID=644352 RepID=J3P2W1_GAET3|nr:hypothetical protein GGTG_07853 [Gaeumannomyces tritici R3-111a-1]EJT74003.1 hypothetical protein GGTG_07853 [Gaeumannomyces tritici R3-111a-1]
MGSHAACRLALQSTLHATPAPSLLSSSLLRHLSAFQNKAAEMRTGCKIKKLAIKSPEPGKSTPSQPVAYSSTKTLPPASSQPISLRLSHLTAARPMFGYIEWEAKAQPLLRQE